MAYLLLTSIIQMCSYRTKKMKKMQFDGDVTQFKYTSENYTYSHTHADGTEYQKYNKNI